MSAARRSTVDVLVVGGGPGGLSAAATAAEHGKQVLLLDQGLRPGGQIWRHRTSAPLPRVARAMLERVRAAGVVIASGTRVVDALGPHELIVDFRGRISGQRTHALVLATGANERFLPFPGWTLPGVVGVGGLQALLKSGLNLSGSKVVIAGTGPLLLPVAAAVVHAGAELLLVAEQVTLRRLTAFGLGLASRPAAIWQAARYRWAFRGTSFRTSSWVVAAGGDERLRRVTVHAGGRSIAMDCDWLATGTGLCPNTELAQLLGCLTDENGIRVDARQATTVDAVWAAGECTGIKGDAAAMVEGEIAGHAAVGDLASASSVRLQRRRDAGRRFEQHLATAFAPRTELLQLADAETIICRCEDVCRGAIDPRWTQRQAKLWTRIGMGECQGAVCGPACAALFGWQTNSARPPLNAPLCGDWSAALRDSADGAQSVSESASVAADASR